MQSGALTPLPPVASLWIGSDLSWLEVLCIQSFLDRGHTFTLYTLDDIAGVPPGVALRPASEVAIPPFDVMDNDRHRVAVFSDIFRLKMLQQTEQIWVDLDAYCVRPFRFDSPYICATSKRGTYPTGVLGLPKDSQTLSRLHTFVTTPNPTPPWRGPRLRRQNAERVAAGETWGIEALKWGCSGPLSFGFFLQETGEARHLMPPEVLYPLAPEELWQLHDPAIPTEAIELPQTHSVHIYGHQKKAIALTMDGLPRPGSYLDRLCTRHGVDPRARRVLPLEWMRPKGA